MKLFKRWQKNYRVLTKNPNLFLMRKIARFEAVRTVASFFFKRPAHSYKISKNNPSLFNNINVELIVSCLQTNGYYLGLNLPQDVLKNIYNYALLNKFYGNRDPKLGYYYSEKEKLESQVCQKFFIGSYLSNTENCPAVKKLRTDPGLLAIAAKFLGSDPVYVGSEILWSFPVPTTMSQRLEAAQEFHYDLDDYRFLKFFFYLTDVDLSKGPHVCIRGSHRNKKFSHQLLPGNCPYKKDIVDYYGAENVLTICEKAGFGFVEDPYCFHKALPPTEKDRLILQIQFAVNKYWNLRKF